MKWDDQSAISETARREAVNVLHTTTWRNDHFTKLGEYEALGIPGCWLV